MSSEEIIKIIDNPLKLRERYWINNYKDTYLLISSSIKLDIPFKQKVWHYINGIYDMVYCVCGNTTNFNKNWKDGYKRFCSSKCTQSNEETKEKRKKTVIDKYGVDNVSKCIDIKKRTEITNIEKYGTKSTFQNIDVRNKWKSNILQKYGVDHYFKSNEFKVMAKTYYLNSLGVEHPLLNEEIKERIKNTCIIKYGVSSYLKTDHAKNSVKKYNRSKYEDELCSFLLDNGIDFEVTNKTILKPNHLDIYIKSHKLAIEFNGLYWHSEIFKHKRYHLDKTIGCNESDIDLIHIWEDDWLNKKEIIKSLIINRLGISDNRIYARKCYIKEVDNKDASEFLNENHIQSYSRFNKAYGLYYNDQLVSFMSFGYRYINSKKEYELIRFCNKININVVGSASKLLKHALSKIETDINEIISYADISMFSGKLYSKIGFKYSRRSDINYWWVVNGIRKHRFTYNKKKLVLNGHDPLKTEVEIMHELGNFRIYGCGQDKYIFYISKR